MIDFAEKFGIATIEKISKKSISDLNQDVFKNLIE
jgi:hypothetical protein